MAQGGLIDRDSSYGQHRLDNEEEEEEVDNDDYQFLVSTSSLRDESYKDQSSNSNNNKEDDDNKYEFEDCDDGDHDFGVLLTLDQHGVCEIQFCRDANFPDIHPNSYAPARLSQVQKLGGGGSGVAVFEGHHPELGNLVMKHGNDKDLTELFALATIAEELTERSHLNPRAADELRQRIPEFRMIYISPHHLGEKRRALWERLHQMYQKSSRNLALLMEEEENDETVDKAPSEINIKNDDKNSTGNLSDLGCSHHSMEELQHLKNKGQQQQNRRQQYSHSRPPSRNGLALSQSGTVSGHRTISVYSGAKECSVELLGDTLRIAIPEFQNDGDTDNNKNNNGSERTSSSNSNRAIQIKGDGYGALKGIVDSLIGLMKEHKWKFTFGQKRIGGEDPKTGNLWLYSRLLTGPLLDNLISEKIQLVKDLASLTTPEEKDRSVLERVRKEVAMFEEEDISPSQLSNEADTFVGKCIKKNFKIGTGRFPVLMTLGRQFREFSIRRWSDASSSQSSFDAHSQSQPEELVLTPEEEIPSYHLGSLTRPGALMGDTFQDAALEPTVLNTLNPFYWRNLLRAAVQPRSEQYKNRTSAMSLTRIWTCGLTDAGLHNLFLSEHCIWLFDLGQPELYSAPGFLTKFLFSFFHTLGMQEEEDTTEGDWVCRFETSQEKDKLRLTSETKELLAEAHEAFGVTLDRMVDDLFDSDDSVRWLLIQYVTLQLFSDASFCLQRWTIKGGGRTRGSNHQRGIEKWLWRALWDMYVAFDINSRETWSKLNVEHPSHRDSVFYADMSELTADIGLQGTLSERVSSFGKHLQHLSESENESESESENENKQEQ